MRLEIPLDDVAAGAQRCYLIVTTLPDIQVPPGSAPALKEGVEHAPPQLLEGSEYHYELISPVPGPYNTDRPELFARDDATGRTGRIITGLFTGRVPIHFAAQGQSLGKALIEVRSQKLHYEREYRWMLRDIATTACELVLQRFGPSEQLLQPDAASDSTSLYQRFAFLQSLLLDESFVASLYHLLERPFSSWRTETELRSPQAGARATSGLARAMSRPGPRSDTPFRIDGGPPIRMPRNILAMRTEETHNNTPNQFVRFVLERWRDEVTTVQKLLGGALGAGVTERGFTETGQVIAQLDDWLGHRHLRELDRLERLPFSDQVLQKRAGYRDVLRAYVESQLAGRLAWEGGDDVYSAGKKDVAALYEYWVFIQLATLCAELCGSSADLSRIVDITGGGLSVVLRRGTAQVVTGSLISNGRVVSLELWYNRHFGSGSSGSWTRPMRPDCSVRLEAEPGIDGGPREMWVHFDAKYRAERLRDLIDVEPDECDAEANRGETEARSASKRDDLLKMHAYRDAIRRSAGAYVVYPGTEDRDFREYHEILPGLGAFALQPEREGAPRGSIGIRQFLLDVVEHVTTQSTNHERAEYWRNVAYASTPSMSGTTAVTFLKRPPADTLVLVGFVRGADHWQWIDATQRYNLRSDGRRGSVGLESRELACRLVLLYDAHGLVSLRSVAGRPEIWAREDMLEAGYPKPRSNTYLCFPISRSLVTSLPSSGAMMRFLSTRWPGGHLGSPRTLSWLEITRLINP